MEEGGINQESRRGHPRLTPRKGFEPFDLWNKANFVLWSNARYDFELIAEIVRYTLSTRRALDLLNSINDHLKNSPDGIFFDGTIKSLKYLVKNNYLLISELPGTTDDEMHLAKLLNKYSERLDVTDILSDIEEPTLRTMLLEYPHLLHEILEDKLAGSFIGQAMLKNGITDAESFIKKVDNGNESIEVDVEKNSLEAMRCKVDNLASHCF